MLEDNSTIVQIRPVIARTFLLYIMYKVHDIMCVILVMVKFGWDREMLYIMQAIHGSKLIDSL